MFCLQSTKANGMKTSFEACRQKVLPVLNDYSIAWHLLNVISCMYLEENSKGNPGKKSENTSLFDSTKQGQSLFTDKANDCVAHDKLFLNKEE